MELTLFHYVVGAVALIMLIWNTVEVGRNDAANIVNAVFGARVMPRNKAVWIAGIAVIIGAMASSPVMETARKGIFDPASLPGINAAISVYIGVYLTNTVLLYTFSAYGMPVSTTACLVFALLGSGFVLGGAEAIHWDKSSKVILGIICSIIVSGIAGFLVQRMFRGVVRDDCEDPATIRLHGPWMAGALMTGLVYFLVMKGMKNVAFVKAIKASTFDTLGAPFALLIIWGCLSLLTFLAIHFWSKTIAKKLFAGLAVLGMIATAIAFGQNDLANCASPGLAIFMILQQGELAGKVDVHWFWLFCCGVLLFMGMTTKTAQRVTRAEVNTGSQGDLVRLYAPQWCIAVARWIVPKSGQDQALAPKPKTSQANKLQHYDALRAAVITSVTGSVIAFASGMGLPVSTTYVAFAAVISTGWADKIFTRGDAALKMGRTVWVVFCWFASAFVAAGMAGVISKIIHLGGLYGIAIGLIGNLTVRYVMRKRADKHEAHLKEQAATRKQELINQSGGDADLKFASDEDGDQM
ncbi:MAG: inorganic phosphate transporter [Verrucomicrobia bacterium]|jgi:phosphate/sulfate permease|nr:inorganic phosphate transporter [Verrucomicrobiota bacterium]